MSEAHNQHWFQFVNATIVREARRGVILFSVLFIVSATCAAATIRFGELAWTVSSFTWAWLFAFAALQLKRKLRIAIWLSNNPNGVFWIHSIDQSGIAIDLKSESCSNIVLHLKNGCRIEVGLEQQARNQFDELRRMVGANIRWGAWNNAETTDHEPTNKLTNSQSPS